VIAWQPPRPPPLNVLSRISQCPSSTQGRWEYSQSSQACLTISPETLSWHQVASSTSPGCRHVPHLSEEQKDALAAASSSKLDIRCSLDSQPFFQIGGHTHHPAEVLVSLLRLQIETIQKPCSPPKFGLRPFPWRQASSSSPWQPPRPPSL